MSKTLWMLRAALITAGLYGYAAHIEPFWTRVAHISLKLPRLDPVFDGYRIAQISDIHMDSAMTRTRLESIVARINAERPDLVAITGDFITRRTHYVAGDLVTALRELQAPDGVVAIPGNHDYYEDQIVNVRRIMAESSIRDLSNSVVSLHRGDAQLHIAGVDDMIYRQARLDLVLNALPATGAAVLLAHEPDFADISAPTRRFDLQLSGHTHGGQIRLPLLGALISPTHGGRYSYGLLDIDGMWLYVNPGIGTVSVRLRFNCRPEISVFRLNAP